MIMEYLGGENLGSEHVPSFTGFVDALSQILDALCYLHNHGIAHEDIKPENIVVQATAPLQIKLRDLGNAFRSNTRYSAPEIFALRHLDREELPDTPPWRPDRLFTVAVDMWSLGVLILQLSPGSLPAMNQAALWPWFEMLLSQVPHLAGTDPNNLWWGSLVGLVEGLLRMNPEERLSAWECLQMVCSGLTGGKEMLALPAA